MTQSYLQCTVHNPLLPKCFSYIALLLTDVSQGIPSIVKTNNDLNSMRAEFNINCGDFHSIASYFCDYRRLNMIA